MQINGYIQLQNKPIGLIAIYKMSSRQTWTSQEDQYLNGLVPTQGKPDWKLISSELNDHFCSKNRSSKQCRERYINYAHFKNDVKASSDWKQSDVDILYESFQIYGTCWGKIAQLLPGKSQNSIKNRFYGALRKVIRKMNKVSRIECEKIKKKLRYESVIRILEAAQTFHNLNHELKKESLQYRAQIFSLMRQNSSEKSNSQILELVQGINRFNLTTRSFRPKKTKRRGARQENDSTTEIQNPNKDEISSSKAKTEEIKNDTDDACQQSLVSINGDKAKMTEQMMIEIEQMGKFDHRERNRNEVLEPVQRADTKQIMSVNQNYSIDQIQFYFHGKLLRDCSPIEEYSLF